MLEYVDWSSVISGAIALLAMVLSAMLALNLRFGMWKQTRFIRFGVLLFACLILFSGANLLEQIMNGRPGKTARQLLHLGCFFDFFFSGMLAFAFSGLLLAITDPRDEAKGTFRVLVILGLLHIGFLLIGAASSLFYYLDPDNVYRRGPGYPLCLVPPGLMLLLDAWILIRAGRRVSREELAELWSILIIPFAALILQVFFKNVAPLAAIIAALVLYVILTKKQVRELYRQQEENLQLRTEVLLSEIQPHFMYNTLGAVADLCDNDPPRAKHTILLLSRYLQGVSGTLNAQKVPFSQELDHIRLYLELAKVRYEDALKVEYRISSTDFSLPPMCLQPLVENALRHGVRKNKGGQGTVTICTAESADCYEISISDDGPGMEGLKPPDRDRMHVGIANVQERLRLLCGGSLELSSASGRGTVATVRIPK